MLAEVSPDQSTWTLSGKTLSNKQKGRDSIAVPDRIME
jgi:hypothetical protein